MIPADTRQRLDDLGERLEALRGYFEEADLEDQLAELDAEMQDPEFWENPEQSTPILRKRSALERRHETLQEIREDEEELRAWQELLAEGEGDEEVLRFAHRLEKKLETLELRLMLSGEQDESSAIVLVHSGAGGTESQDWAEMLARMYLRWAEQNEFEVEILDRQEGEEAGLKSITFAVRGSYAYGYLKAENGVHRLVRISPFDAASRRHTSFASVYVCPEIEDDIEIEIDENDLRIDTFRASGAGGQHVNKTESAVRITHEPSGIVVSCQNERSQHKNRATAFKVLRARLYDLELKQREEEQAKREGEKKEIAWGSQIRSYVLHPYRMVKDHRTGVEIGDADRVLDGDIDPFIEAWLKEQMPAARVQVQ
ncbi:MAG: peptide chain release factor 2 [Thermoanaerobaculia bacterium]|nr:peptide chain release factor 2 [Thermoanaerobaculia bacterium]